MGDDGGGRRGGRRGGKGGGMAAEGTSPPGCVRKRSSNDLF